MGTIIDQYTRWDCDPLCKAVACLDYRATPERVNGKTAIPLAVPPPMGPPEYGTVRWRATQEGPKSAGISVEAPGIEDGRAGRRSGIDGWIFHRNAIDRRGAGRRSGAQERWAAQGGA